TLLVCASLSPSFFLHSSRHPRDPPSFPTRRSSDLRSGPGNDEQRPVHVRRGGTLGVGEVFEKLVGAEHRPDHSNSQLTTHNSQRSEEHTSELQSLRHLVCRLLLEKKKNTNLQITSHLMHDIVTISIAFYTDDHYPYNLSENFHINVRFRDSVSSCCDTDAALLRLA